MRYVCEKGCAIYHQSSVRPAYISAATGNDSAKRLLHLAVRSPAWRGYSAFIWATAQPLAVIEDGEAAPSFLSKRGEWTPIIRILSYRRCECDFRAGYP